MLNSKKPFSGVQIEPLERSRKTVAVYSHDAIIVSLAGDSKRLGEFCSELPEGGSLNDNDDGSGSLVLSADSICQFNARYRDWFMDVGLEHLEEMGIASCQILTENCFNSSLEWLISIIYNYNLKYGEDGAEARGKDIELSFCLFEDIDNYLEEDIEDDLPQGLIFSSGIDPALFFEDDQIFWNSAGADSAADNISTGKPRTHSSMAAIQTLTGLLNSPDEEEPCCLNPDPANFCGFYDRL